MASRKPVQLPQETIDLIDELRQADRYPPETPRYLIIHQALIDALDRIPPTRRKQTRQPAEETEKPTRPKRDPYPPGHPAHGVWPLKIVSEYEDEHVIADQDGNELAGPYEQLGLAQLEAKRRNQEAAAEGGTQTGDPPAGQQDQLDTDQHASGDPHDHSYGTE